MTFGREQRESMTNITDTLPEIDSRAFEAISVEEVASPIDSTRPDLPQRFGLSGQNEQLQAQPEIKRSDKAATTRRAMSKVQLDIMVIKREALKKDADVGKKMSFVMSSLNSVILLKQSNSEPTKDTTVMRAMLDGKVPLQIMKRATAVQVEYPLGVTRVHHVGRVRVRALQFVKVVVVVKGILLRWPLFRVMLSSVVAVESDTGATILMTSCTLLKRA